MRHFRRLYLKIKGGKRQKANPTEAKSLRLQRGEAANNSQTQNSSRQERNAGKGEVLS